MTNPIIDEVRAARAAIAAEHGYDRAKILQWARAEQAALKNKHPKETPLPTQGQPEIRSTKKVQRSPRT